MKCTDCRVPMESKARPYRYAECGLPNVTLRNVEVRTCPKCGAESVVIPRIDELHGLLADAVVRKRARLAPQEVRFLRKYIGFSGVDFARACGVTPETVSRWENGAPMGAQADRMLRLMVLVRHPIEAYPLEELAEIGDGEAPSIKVALESGKHGWHAAAA
jgi:putative zinc finger/helix-turn-helix YgiT family protein